MYRSAIASDHVYNIVSLQSHGAQESDYENLPMKGTKFSTVQQHVKPAKDNVNMEENPSYSTIKY